MNVECIIRYGKKLNALIIPCWIPVKIKIVVRVVCLKNQPPL